MIEIAKIIGRIIALLVDKGVITREEAIWVTDSEEEGAEND